MLVKMLINFSDRVDYDFTALTHLWFMYILALYKPLYKALIVNFDLKKVIFKILNDFSLL